MFVVGEDGRAHERPVKTDDIIRNSMLVTAGVKPGERIVSVGADNLYEGALVEARPGRQF